MISYILFTRIVWKPTKEKNFVNFHVLNGHVYHVLSNKENVEYLKRNEREMVNDIIVFPKQFSRLIEQKTKHERNAWSRDSVLLINASFSFRFLGYN